MEKVWPNQWPFIVVQVKYSHNTIHRGKCCILTHCKWFTGFETFQEAVEFASIGAVEHRYCQICKPQEAN